MTTGPGEPLLCSVCNAGMFRSTVSLSNTDVCLTCPSGRYNLDHTSNAFDSSSDKSTAAAFHNELTDCLFCAVGRSFTTQTTTCDICGGKYRLRQHFLIVPLVLTFFLFALFPSFLIFQLQNTKMRTLLLPLYVKFAKQVASMSAVVKEKTIHNTIV